MTCSKCHTLTNHYTDHGSVDCIACHFTGFARSKGQAAHDVFRDEKTNRVRPLAVKYNEAISWYPHNIVKPGRNLCGTQCHYDGNILGLSVLSSVLLSSVVPDQFELKQNYPNPVTSMTFIPYRIASSQHVTIQVFDIYGQLVKTVLNERQNAGTYQAEFDASGLPMGTYFYKLTAGRFAQAKRLMVVN